MRFYQVDPTTDPRWAGFVDRHARASLFHSVAWLTALRRTYGYEPVVFTTSAPTADLSNGIVFCHVKSWLTGHRLVSLPFSDHCEPLFESAGDVNFLIRYLQASLEREQWRYLEIRPFSVAFDQSDHGASFVPAARYFINTLDLRPEVHPNLGKGSVPRELEPAGLVEKCGASDDLVREFYRLLAVTRDPLDPPYAWFRNLFQCQGPALEVRLAYQRGIPIAAILTLQFRDVVYCKHGCADRRFDGFRAMPWLLSRAIAAAKSKGAGEFHMGRTAEDHSDLLAFQNQPPRSKRLVYWRYSDDFRTRDSADSWKLKMAKRAFSHMPSSVSAITGGLLYRHLA